MVFDEGITQAVADFNKTVAHLKLEFSRVQVGRANSSLVEGLNIEDYGSMQPLKAVATVSVPDPKTIQIQAWDRDNLVAIEKAITNSSLGLSPNNDGVVIRINIPPLTEERRTTLKKVVSKLAEEAHIGIRNARQVAHKLFKQLKDDSEMTEDDIRDAEKQLQSKVDDANKQVDDLRLSKEKDVMTV